MSCAICHTRRPRRYCPGVHGEICSVCCGTEREVTVDCPLDCEYLIEARKHEQATPIDEHAIPNADIRVSRKDLEAHEELVVFAIRSIVMAALGTPGVVDFDVRDALDGLIKTYRTLQSGVYYESVPPNPLAAMVYRAMQQGLTAFREEERRRLGQTKTRDTDVLKALVYLQRIELDRNNGRRRGRAFLGALQQYYGIAPQEPVQDSPSSLILP